MSRRISWWGRAVCAAAISLCAASLGYAETLAFDDGQCHIVNEPVYADMTLDYGVVNVPGTYVDMLAGSSAVSIRTYHNAVLDFAGSTNTDIVAHGSSTVTLLAGGHTNFGLAAHDDAVLNLLGGTVGEGVVLDGSAIGCLDGATVMYDMVIRDSASLEIKSGAIGANAGSFPWGLYVDGSSAVAVSGGSIASHCVVRGISVVSLSGGVIGGDLQVYDSGTMYLEGTGFTVTANGVTTSLLPGDRLSDYGQYVDPYGQGGDHWSGVVSGTLADGTALTCLFAIFDKSPVDGQGLPDIVVVPEPGTLGLLAVCGLAILRRRKA